MSYRYTPEAERDFEELADFVSNASVAGALRLIERIESAVDCSISKFPAIGRVRPDLTRSPRSWSVDGWLILYRITEADDVVVVRIIHGSRDLDAGLDADDR